MGTLNPISGTGVPVVTDDSVNNDTMGGDGCQGAVGGDGGGSHGLDALGLLGRSWYPDRCSECSGL